MTILPRVIITGAFRFPEGDAAAARVLGVGKALRSAGYQVEFAGWEEGERKDDVQQDGTYRYQGFSYVSQGDLRHVPLSPAKRLIRYLLAGQNTLNWLSSIDLGGVRVIIAYHGGSAFLLRLARLCRRRGIRLLFDCTEWYKPSSLVGGRFGPVALDNEFRMRCVNRLIGKGIVISAYLEAYYSTRHCDVLRVPPLVDLVSEKWSGCESQLKPVQHPGRRRSDQRVFHPRGQFLNRAGQYRQRGSGRFSVLLSHHRHGDQRRDDSSRRLHEVGLYS